MVARSVVLLSALFAVSVAEQSCGPGDPATGACATNEDMVALQVSLEAKEKAAETEKEDWWNPLGGGSVPDLSVGGMAKKLAKSELADYGCCSTSLGLGWTKDTANCLNQGDVNKRKRHTKLSDECCFEHDKALVRCCESARGGCCPTHDATACRVAADQALFECAGSWNSCMPNVADASCHIQKPLIVAAMKHCVHTKHKTMPKCGDEGPGWKKPASSCRSEITPAIKLPNGKTFPAMQRTVCDDGTVVNSPGGGYR